jgi:hypothetical protein
MINTTPNADGTPNTLPCRPRVPKPLAESFRVLINRTDFRTQTAPTETPRSPKAARLLGENEGKLRGLCLAAAQMWGLDNMPLATAVLAEAAGLLCPLREHMMPPASLPWVRQMRDLMVAYFRKEA